MLRPWKYYLHRSITVLLHTANDRLYSPSVMLSEEEFWQKWRKFFKKNTYPPQYRKYGLRYPDDDDMDVILLVVMDDIDPEV